MRRETDDQPHFHYDRQERLARRPTGDQPATGGFFRRNRSLAIVVVDVIVVVLIFLIYQLFLKPDPSTIVAEGVQFVARAVAVDRDVFVTIRATVLVDSAAHDAIVEFRYLFDTPAVEHPVATLTEVLPSPGHYHLYRQIIALPAAAASPREQPRNIVVEVSTLAFQVTVIAPIAYE